MNAEQRILLLVATLWCARGGKKNIVYPERQMESLTVGCMLTVAFSCCAVALAEDLVCNATGPLAPECHKAGKLAIPCACLSLFMAFVMFLMGSGGMGGGGGFGRR